MTANDRVKKVFFNRGVAGSQRFARLSMGTRERQPQVLSYRSKSIHIMYMDLLCLPSAHLRLERLADYSVDYGACRGVDLGLGSSGSGSRTDWRRCAATAEIGGGRGHFDSGCKALLSFIGRAHKGFELRCAFYEACWAWSHHGRRSTKLYPRCMRHYPPVMRALAAAERIVFLLRLPVRDVWFSVSPKPVNVTKVAAKLSEATV